MGTVPFLQGDRPHFFRTLLVTVALGVFVATPAAFAQVPYSPSPRVSPYINLNQPGLNPGITYYGVIRPEVNFRSSIRQLQQQGAATEQAVTTLETAATAVLPPTGHAFGFQNHGRYFQRLGSTGPRAAVPAAATRPIRQQQPARR
jgi:hypothetical protein